MQEQYNKLLLNSGPKVKEYPQGKTSYTIKVVTFSVVGTISFFVLQAFLSVIFNDFDLFLRADVFNFTIIIVPLTTLFSSLATEFGRIKNLRKIEKKRQTAIEGNKQLLADIQPQARVSKIPIIFHYRRNRKLKIFGFFFCLFPTYFIILLLLITPRFLTMYPFQELTLIIWLLLVSILLFRSMIKNRTSRLVADETGIALFLGEKRRQYILWHEARFFTIVDTLQKNKLDQPNLFELASESEILQWKGRSKLAWEEDLGIVIALTEDQYQWQLQELHALIVHMIGLAMFDLRK